MPETNQTDQQTEPRQKLREHFLEMFIRELIVSSYDPKKDKELQERFMKDKLEDMAEELKRTPAVTLQEIPLSKQPKAIPSNFATTHSPQEIGALQKKFGLIEPQSHPYPRVAPMPKPGPIPLPQPAYQPTKLKPGQKIETVNLGKLAGILVDPSVLSIECPGPYKNLLVNRSGSIQTSSVTLTPEEINAMMHNVSEQTRIPVTPGVFRAAIQDLVITAVLSDFVGTRFVIQKRNPFQRY